MLRELLRAAHLHKRQVIAIHCCCCCFRPISAAGLSLAAAAAAAGLALRPAKATSAQPLHSGGLSSPTCYSRKADSRPSQAALASTHKQQAKLEFASLLIRRLSRRRPWPEQSDSNGWFLIERIYCVHVQAGAKGKSGNVVLPDCFSPFSLDRRQRVALQAALLLAKLPRQGQRAGQLTPGGSSLQSASPWAHTIQPTWPPTSGPDLASASFSRGE